MQPEVRELTAADASNLRDFFAALPAEDRTFFFADVTDPAVADAWARDDRRLRRCACGAEGEILAFAALEPGVDWSSHVAEMYLVVAPHARRQQLGRTLARAILIEAVERGFKKVTIRIAADNTGAIRMFQSIGFEGEALLRDQLCSPHEGQMRDMVILAHMVDDQWATMLTGGFDEALG
jgi:ribosomal protein S18 acetylase RimI-like enzyme